MRWEKTRKFGSRKGGCKGSKGRSLPSFLSFTRGRVTSYYYLSSFPSHIYSLSPSQIQHILRGPPKSRPSFHMQAKTYEPRERALWGLDLPAQEPHRAHPALEYTPFLSLGGVWWEAAPGVWFVRLGQTAKISWGATAILHLAVRE